MYLISHVFTNSKPLIGNQLGNYTVCSISFYLKVHQTLLWTKVDPSPRFKVIWGRVRRTRGQNSAGADAPIASALTWSLWNIIQGRNSIFWKERNKKTMWTNKHQNWLWCIALHHISIFININKISKSFVGQN